MPDLTLRTITDDLAFPEGPIALPDGAVVLVEIARGTLTLVTPQGARHTIADLGGGPNGAALGPDGAYYVCNNGGFEWSRRNGLLLPRERASDYETGRIERVDPATGAVERLYDHWQGVRLNGPNDIVFDRAGGFYFTDFGKTYDGVRDLGAIYYAHADGTHIERLLFPLDQPNGIGLSPDETVLYVADSITRTLWAYDIAAPGQLKAQEGKPPRGRALASPGDLQFFDSLAVEAGGAVCVATIRNAGITRVGPDGAWFEHYATDDPMTTNLAFGGADLATAYITLSGTGRLVAAPWPAPGLPLNFLNV